MPERIVITLTVIAGLGLVWLGWHYYKARLGHAIRPVGLPPGKPALLYFTGEYCTACKLQQTPIVEQIRGRLGDSVAVKTYDVSAYPDLAGRYKVLTLPTTIVVNARGQVTHINYGVTDVRKLEAQLM